VILLNIQMLLGLVNHVTVVALLALELLTQLPQLKKIVRPANLDLSSMLQQQHVLPTHVLHHLVPDVKPVPLELLMLLVVNVKQVMD